MRTVALRLLGGFVALSLGLTLAGCGGSAAPVVTISPASSQSIDQGQSLSLTASVANDTAAAGVSWAVSGGGTLSNSTTTGTTYTAPSSVSSATSVTVTATSVAKSTASATHSITVSPAPSITTTTLAAGTVGTAYSVTLAATGGAGTLTWTVNSGTLPAGLNLSSAGVLSGTPTAPASATLTFKVTDSSAATPLTATTGNITLTVNPVTLAITAPTLANGIVGTAYTSAAYTTTGGTGAITWSASGLPAGLSINSSTGVISGTPTTAGTSSTVVVTATDSGPTTFQQTKSTTAVSVVVYPTLTIGSLSAASAIQNTTALNIAPTASGGFGTYTWSATGLPAGVSISSSTGAITGTPTTATGSPFTVNVTVTDSGTPSQSKSSSFTLTVAGKLSITTSSLPNAVATTAYSTTVASSGGTGSITWSATGLPTGLSINSTTGAITGTVATTAGSPFTVNLTATDSGTGPLAQTASSSLSLTILAHLDITSTTLPTATIGVAYNATVTVSGGVAPITCSTTGLPPGLNLNTSTCVISGTPTSPNAGSQTFHAQNPSNVYSNNSYSVTATDSGTPQQTATASFTLTLDAGTPIVKTTTLPSASVNVAYSTTLQVDAAGQPGAATWAVTSGASALTTAGFSLNTATGAITGTPTSTAGSPISIGVTVTVGGSTSAQQNLTLTIVAGPSITTSSLAPAYVNTAYSATLNSTGGSGGNTWTVTSGQSLLTTLGLTLTGNGNSATLAGTPTTAASGSVTFQVKDSNNATGTATLNVGAYNQLGLPAPNPSSLPGASVTSVYSGSIAASGGVGPNYTWTVNSTQLTNNTPFALTGTVTGLSATTTGNGTLSIAGTPSGVGTVSFTASVKDGANTTVGPTTYTIAVTTTYSISGTITTSSNCGIGTNIAGVSVALGGGSTATTTTDSSGHFSFTGLTSGLNYTVTPSFSNGIFYPAVRNYNNLSNNSTQGNFIGDLGYSVSGTVSYAGSKTGRVYLYLNPTGCGGGGNSGYGTSVNLTSGSSAFTIRGVPPGNYQLKSFMDVVGQGTLNLVDPGGNGVATVSTANVTGANVTLSDPTLSSLATTTPQVQAAAGFSGGAIVLYKPVTATINNNKVEEAISYTLEWSATTSFATVIGSKTFTATGPDDATVWIVNGLTNGSVYYFRFKATDGSTTTQYSAVAGPVTPNAPSGGNVVSGTVSFTPPTGTSPGPLYVGFVDQSNGGFYFTSFASPTVTSGSVSQNYTVNVPTGSNYLFVAIDDMNNNGALDVGDISDTNNLKASTSITGATTGLNLSLSGANASAAVLTQDFRSTPLVGNTTDTYTLNFQVFGITKLPVAVALTSGASVLTTRDIGICTSCGKAFNFPDTIYSSTPVAGGAYGLQVTYSDGTSETLSPTISNPVFNAFATALKPSGTTYTQGSGTSVTPTFTWTNPSGGSSYQYQFYISDNTGNTVWQVPGNNSDSNGIPYATTSLTWDADPIDGNNNRPFGNGGSLTAGTQYGWNIQVRDAAGNSTIQQVQYKP